MNDLEMLIDKNTHKVYFFSYMLYVVGCSKEHPTYSSMCKNRSNAMMY